MESTKRYWLCAFVVVAGVVALVGCTTKQLETADTSTTSTTSATRSTSGQSTSSTTATNSDGSTTTSTPAEVWSLNASTYRGQDGLRVSLDCTAGGDPTIYSVWGTGTYTDDSSVCAAGVHAGRITAAQGGTVRIEIAPGQESYEGSVANGVTSTSYGPWEGSYFFVSD